MALVDELGPGVIAIGVRARRILLGTRPLADEAGAGQLSGFVVAILVLLCLVADLALANDAPPAPRDELDALEADDGGALGATGGEKSAAVDGNRDGVESDKHGVTVVVVEAHSDDGHD